MKKKHFAGLSIGALMVAVVAFMSPTVQAQATGTIEATTTVCAGLTVTGTDALAFGSLSAPTDVCAEWTISPTNGPMIKTGGNSVDPFPGDHSAGEFRIDGEASMSVSYSVSITADFGDAGLSLTAVTFDPASPETLDGAGQAWVDIGGTLEICPGATPGFHNDAEITLTANY